MPRLLPVLFSLLPALVPGAGLGAVEPGTETGRVDATATATDGDPVYYIQEYRVQGSKTIPPLVVEEAVYPYLGRGRTAADVERARASLEKAYHQRGFQAVVVEVPPQDVAEGVVFLKVLENPVGRLRVRGTRFFTPGAIKARAPELAEGNVLNFEHVNKAVMRLNQLRDLRVTPEVKAGVEPGTVDVDLIVKDTVPVHGSIELNNRYSQGTTKWRLNGSISYENLWQAGHAAGFSFQVAPEKPSDATVYSAYYLARFREIDWLSLLLQGTKQDSDVSTLGGVAVAGRGESLGLRILAALPGSDKFFHSLSGGGDWKRFDEDVEVDGQTIATPIEYFPLSVNYGASWAAGAHSTDLMLGVHFALRGLGSDRFEFDAKRYNATGGYLYLRGDLSHTRELPGGFQAFAKVQGQASADNLINNEQYSGGGLGTVRGYLESAALGDNALLGTLELRSPSLIGRGDSKRNEWRVYGFLDGGRLALNDPLPEQEDVFDLLSIGLGSRFKVVNHTQGTLDLGYPLRGLSDTERGDWRLSFRLWAEF